MGMETKTLLNNVAGSNASEKYFINSGRDNLDTQVQLFLVFSAGTVTVEASADGVNFAPVKDGVFTASEVVPLDLADGSYMRVSYSGATALTATVMPKVKVNA